MADLTTLEKVRTHLAVASIDADAVLSGLVTSSSQWVLSQLGRPILTASYTEVRDGDGSTRLRLDKCPATQDEPPVTVTSVTVDGTVVPQRAAVTAQNTNPTGWVYRRGGIDLIGYVFTKGTQNVSIVYTVGYAVCPVDLEQAVVEHVALKYRARTHEGQGSASAGGDAVSYSDSGAWKGIYDAIERYAAMGVG